jgi:hypothetical protein
MPIRSSVDRLSFLIDKRLNNRTADNERRLTFYTLALRLSLVAGPLRLLDGGFPDRDVMMKIAEHNLQEVLAFPATGAAEIRPGDDGA